MFSALYGDLPKAKRESDKGKSPTISSENPLQKDATSNKGQLAKGWQGRGQSTTAMAPAVLQRVSTTPSQQNQIQLEEGCPKQVKRQKPSIAATQENSCSVKSAQQVSRNVKYDVEVEDPYDPSTPNEYEKIRKEREFHRKKLEEEAEKLEKQREEALGVHRLGLNAQAQDHSLLPSIDDPNHTKYDFVDDQGGQMAGQQAQGAGVFASAKDTGEPNSFGTATGGPSMKGMGLAQKMLEKMGWKSGEGLGKNKQGISSALMVEKTDIRSGRVVESEIPPERNTLSVEQLQKAPMQQPSRPEARVIILKNIVGPGEVDETLDEEIGVECSKHGEVLSVVIFEVTEKSYPQHAAVRVFVEFKSVKAAIAAVNDLNGRYFGGRVVHADFFNVDKFEDNDLAPEPDEDRV